MLSVAMAMDVAGAFDAWGSNVVGGLVGGLVGAAFVVVGVHYAQALSDNRKAKEDRRAAGNGLVIQVSNLRDDACSRSRGTTGDYAMWRMRNDLFVTHRVLDGYPSYEEATVFYNVVYIWREWARTHPVHAGARSDKEAEFLSDYRERLRGYSDLVIELLQRQLEDGPIDFRRPVLPPLPE